MDSNQHKDKETHSTKTEIVNNDNHEDEWEHGVEPWLESVDGKQLAEEINGLFSKHIIVQDSAIIALTLWVFGTYCFNAFNIFPKLLITSPEKRCGKTTLLELLSVVVHKGLLSSNISPAAIFRTIEAWQPTLLIDEADTFISASDELKGIINSGHRKSAAYVIRVESNHNQHTPKRFNTWAPMVISMIKNPPDTIIDRSIKITLKRKLPSEITAKMHVDINEQLKYLRQKLKRWGIDNHEKLKQINVKIPVINNDRAMDNWYPLFSIAHLLGEKWAKDVEDSYRALTAIDDDQTLSMMLLEDIKRIFSKMEAGKLHSDVLVCELIKIKESPWGECNHGRSLTSNKLARFLRPFGIHSRQVWINDRNKNGYELRDFGDAFKRYLSDACIQSSKPLETRTDNNFNDLQNSRLNYQSSNPSMLNNSLGVCKK